MDIPVIYSERVNELYSCLNSPACACLPSVVLSFTLPREQHAAGSTNAFKGSGFAGENVGVFAPACGVTLVNFHGRSLGCWMTRCFVRVLGGGGAALLSDGRVGVSVHREKPPCGFMQIGLVFYVVSPK